MKKLIIILTCLFLAQYLWGQVQLEWNALVDLEGSVAGSKSHYYYNEIHEDFTDPRIGITQVNLIGKVQLGDQWQWNTRLLLERNLGQRLERFDIPQLNLQWLSKNRRLGITIGRFVNPFGGFNHKQLSIDRTFIGLPLAYSFYVNVSDQIGFVSDMGDVEKIQIDSTVQWGSANIYYGGYSTGALFSWNIQPGKVNWKVALTNGASNVRTGLASPLQWGVISRLKWQPTYFWEQGFSLSHGTFFRSSEVSDQLDDLRRYSQTIIGTDFKTGKGYVEISGELMGVFYRVPVFSGEDRQFVTDDGEDIQNLANLAAYLDVRYEVPVLPGSYFAYRIDHLNFNTPSGFDAQEWDNDIWRHSLAIGYRINPFLLLRGAVSTQQVDNKTWSQTQRTYRIVLTAHY